MTELIETIAFTCPICNVPIVQRGVWDRELLQSVPQIKRAERTVLAQKLAYDIGKHMLNEHYNWKRKVSHVIIVPSYEKCLHSVLSWIWKAITKKGGESE